MTEADAIAELRAALEAVTRGMLTPEAGVTALRGALEAGRITGEDAESLLRAVLPADTAADFLARLGPVAASRVSAATRMRGTDSSVPPPATPLAGETRLRRSGDAPHGGVPRDVPASPMLDADAPTPAEFRTLAGGSATGQEAMPDGVDVGTLLGGRYRLERRLGEGGMGVVYFAVDEQVRGESFAIKVLRPEIRDMPEALDLMRMEVSRTRSLSHPNIVGVYSLNAEGSHVYMLMEYLEGKPLDALIDQDFGRGLPFERAWPLIHDIGAALAFAHDRSVIHSDLKPSNVFVTTGGRVKLLDFGIARIARGRRQGVDAAALGALTLEYSSCEMIEGQKPDVRDDIYALGCVIYEMLSGRHVFGGDSAVAARDQHRRPAPIASLSRSQNAALARALAFDREQRTGSVEELLKGLRRAPLVTARRAAVAAAVVIGIGVAGAVGWWNWANRHPSSARPPAADVGTLAEANGVLQKVRALEARAYGLGVDPADTAFATGSQALKNAERQLATFDTDGATRSLSEAQTALTAAMTRSGRIARIGSDPEEVLLAVNLCRQRGARCSEADFADEAPRTAVLKPFRLDPATVTNREFAEFAQATGYKTEAERGVPIVSIEGSRVVAHPKDTWRTLRDQDAPAGADASLYPVRGVDFGAAKAYCEWRGARLPTEEEWEFVARGSDHRVFAWGNDAKRPAGPGARRLLPVVEQPATGRFGVRGLGSVLLEWVDGGSNAERVLRGVSWLDADPVHQRLAQRGLEDPRRAHVDTGFRCARSTEEWPDEPAS